MTRAVVAECGFCGKAEGVATFTVSEHGATVVIDLCKLHGKPFRRALREGAHGPRRRQAPPPAYPRHSFTPVD